jgi:O-antigen/teichoic acid export membrane protein
MPQDGERAAHEIAAAFVRAGSSTVIGFVLRAATTKIFAVTAGPDGIAIFGLIRQIMDVMILAATPGGGAAIVQAVSGAAATTRDGIIRTAAVLTLAGSVTITALLAFGGPAVFRAVAGDAAPVLAAQTPWIALMILLGVAGAFCGAVVNGKGQYATIVFAGAVGSFAVLIIAYPVGKAAEGGNFLPYVLLQALSPVVMIAMAARALEPRRWLSSTRGTGFDPRAARQLYGLSLWLEMMGLAAAGSGIAVRLLLLSSAGLAAVGAFTAAFQMSAAFLALLTAPLQMYHLPSLSTAREAEEKRRMLDAFLSFSGLLGGGAAVVLIAAKSLLIELLYTSDFVPALAFLDWFFPGLYIQALSSVYGHAMLAAGSGRAACGVEAVRSGTFVALTAAALFVADDPSLIGPAFLVTRALGLWLAARTAGRIYGTRPAEPMGRRLRRLVPAATVTAVAAVAMGRPSFDWTVATLSGTALLVLVAAARPQERAALADAFLGHRKAD